MPTSAKRSQRDNSQSPGRAAAEGPVLVRLPLMTGDRVVDRLLRRGLLDPDEVSSWRDGWEQARLEGAREPLWRYVGRQEGVDVRELRRVAADAYGFRNVRISLVGTLAVADFLRTEWPADAYPRLVACSALPVSVEGDPYPGRLVIASSDAANPALPRLVDGLVTGPYALAHAEETDLSECMAAIRRLLPDLLPEGLVRLVPSASRETPAARKAA